MLATSSVSPSSPPGLRPPADPAVNRPEHRRGPQKCLSYPKSTAGARDTTILCTPPVVRTGTKKNLPALIGFSAIPHRDAYLIIRSTRRSSRTFTRGTTRPIAHCAARSAQKIVLRKTGPLHSLAGPQQMPNRLSAQARRDGNGRAGP
jgi:hypothetical protein